MRGNEGADYPVALEENESRIMEYVAIFALGALAAIGGERVLRRLTRGHPILFSVFGPIESIAKRWPHAGEGLIFVATAVYAVFAILQWSATRENVQLTRQTLISANRPWMVLAGVSPTSLKPGEPTEVKVTLINTGRSVALDFAGEVNSAYGPQEFPDEPPFEGAKGHPSKASIGASQTVSISLEIRAFTPEQIADFESGKIKVYVYGRADYRDEFSNRGGLKFCQKLQKDGSYGSCSNFNAAY